LCCAAATSTKTHLWRQSLFRLSKGRRADGHGQLFFGLEFEARQPSGEAMKLHAFARLAAEPSLPFMSQIAMGHRTAFAGAHRNHVDENFCP
jgi:hypothetical protein